MPCPDSSSSFQARAPSHLGVCIIVQAVVMPGMMTFQQWLPLPACQSMPCYVERFSYKTWSRSFPFQRHWSSHQRITPWLRNEERDNGRNVERGETKDTTRDKIATYVAYLVRAVSHTLAVYTCSRLDTRSNSSALTSRSTAVLALM